MVTATHGQDQEEQPQCRICYETTPPLLQPCRCKGTIGYVHEACVVRWLIAQPDAHVRCELCHIPYNVDYCNPFETVFDIVGEDYYTHISPVYISMFVYIFLQMYVPTPFLLQAERQEFIDALYMPIQYGLYIAYNAVFFHKAQIKNWRLYLRYLVGSGYINIVSIYIVCLLMIPYNGIYAAIPANVIQPTFFYIHNAVAKKINSENRLVFRPG
jgi:hypothetical protein